MKVTLHIGSTKTGSSALQAHLFEARHLLAEAGILYPDVGVKSNAQHVLFGAVHPTAWGMHRDELSQDIKERNRFIADSFETVFAQADAKGIDHVILSSEYLWGVLPPPRVAQLARHLKEHDVHIVAAVRRQDYWLESSYLQAVKSGEKRQFSDWLDAFLERPVRGVDFLAVLDCWNAALNPVRIDIVPYEFKDRTAFTRHMIDTVTGRFLGSSIVPATAHRVNVSPDAKGLESLLRFNNAPNQDRSLVGSLLRTMHRVENSRDSVTLTPEIRDRILSRFSHVNREIVRKYAPHLPAGLFDEAVT